MRTLAIGDVHGCLRALDALLQQVELQPDDVLVMLGDYVDRGPDSRGVLERLLSLRSGRLVFLKGNHELMMLAARADPTQFSDWLLCGGKQTLESYQVEAAWEAFIEAVPEEHWHFLEETCRSHFETEAHFFVHANAVADLPISDQPDYMLYWEKLEAAQWRPHESGKTMICGHSVQRSGRPLLLDRAICIDTWVYGDGWLTCLDLAREVYWQASQRGQTRTGTLGFRSR